MKIFDIQDKSGRSFAFEVRNALLGRSGAVKAVRSIPGAIIIRRPRFFVREEEFCEFEVGGQRFKIWEPFGDNSRYWVGPEPVQWCEQTAVVREAFARFRVLSFGFGRG